MSLEAKSKGTLIGLIRYLREEIYALTEISNPTLSEDELQKIATLSFTVEHLMDFANKIGDRALYDILDDFTYALNETEMGAPAKGKSELDDCFYRIDDYEKQDSWFIRRNVKISFLIKTVKNLPQSR